MEQLIINSNLKYQSEEKIQLIYRTLNLKLGAYVTLANTEK